MGRRACGNLKAATLIRGGEFHTVDPVSRPRFSLRSVHADHTLWVYPPLRKKTFEGFPHCREDPVSERRHWQVSY